MLPALHALLALAAVLGPPQPPPTVFAAPAPAVVGDFATEPTPVHEGTRAVVDLPAALHIRNTGGIGRRGPGTGAGLCVFTSAQVLARYLNLPQMEGFQKWMTAREGGGWPEKLDAMIRQFCQEKGVTAPDYVQHTGGDDAFLDVAVKTGRGAAVTYAGMDGFYPGVIAHMVNLAHLDADRAAIIDNNRPGAWVWMTRKEFLTRWRANGGGWAFVWLAPPPPPYVGSPPARLWAGVPAGAAGGEVPADGVDAAKVHDAKRYTLNGQEVTREEALSAVAGANALADDSEKWSLSVVGDAAFLARVRADFDKAPADLRSRLHLQLYAPDAWAVAQYGLKTGVTLRRPKAGRAGEEVGSVGLDAYDLAALLRLLDALLPKPAPAPTPAPPAPSPAPQPQPPTPTPDPAPTPAAPTNPLLILLGTVLALLWAARSPSPPTPSPTPPKASPS